MVHALHEAWRVLVPQGILIDLRPTCTDVPLEILYKDGGESAGLVDLSPGRTHDQAADEAIDSVIREGIFKELKSEYFVFTNYWKSIEEMMVDWKDRWWEDANLSDEVLLRASLIIKQHHSRARLRLRTPEILVTYVKQ